MLNKFGNAKIKLTFSMVTMSQIEVEILHYVLKIKMKSIEEFTDLFEIR